MAAADKPFRFPATFTFVVRSFTVLDGIGKGLDPRFDISEIAGESGGRHACVKGESCYCKELDPRIGSFLPSNTHSPAHQPTQSCPPAHALARLQRPTRVSCCWRGSPSMRSCGRSLGRSWRYRCRGGGAGLQRAGAGARQ